MNKYTYTGSKIQNHFTAYLIQFVRGKRHDYLEKKIQMADAEELLEDIGQMEARIVIEELMENQTREQLLLQEAQGKYPEWNNGDIYITQNDCFDGTYDFYIIVCNRTDKPDKREGCRGK